MTSEYEAQLAGKMERIQNINLSRTEEQVRDLNSKFEQEFKNIQGKQKEFDT